LKKVIQSLLQKILGYDRYLFWFAWFKSKTITNDTKEGDFVHFLSLVQSQHHVLDIGANIGIMTVNLARKAKHVWAFEPITENITALKQIIKHHHLQNVTLFPIALGAQNDDVQMVLPVVQSVKMQGLAHVVHPDLIDFNEGITYTVKQRTLDSIEELQQVPIAAIKLDVENFEYQVLLGAQKLITRCKPIIYCELWDNANRQKCFELLSEWGYQIYVIVNGKRVGFDASKHKTQNFLMIYPLN
jgi:FkbM family methyltransferase